MFVTAGRQAAIARGLLAFVVVGTVAVAVVATYVQLRTDQPSARLILATDLVLSAIRIGTALLGYLIVVRRDMPTRRLGVILLVITVTLTFSALGNTYGSLSWQYLDDPLPFARAIVWIPYAIVEPVTFPLTVLLILMFPDGRLPSRRWRFPVWGILGGFGLGHFVTLAFGNTPYYFVYGRWITLPKTFAVAPEALLGPLEQFHQILRDKPPRVILPAAVVVLALKLRRTRGDERRQVAVMVAGAALYTVLFLWAGTVCGILGFNPEPFTAICVPTSVATGHIALPAAIAVAVFRYRLWSLDIVINKALVAAGLVAFVAATYGTVVVAVGTVVGNQGRPSIATSLLAMTLVAVAFEPVRSRVQRAANRLVYGDRATPYESMAAFARSVSDAVGTDEVLPRMAATAGRGVGARAARVSLDLDDGSQHTAVWPDEPESWAEAHTEPVVHDGQRIGDIAVVKPRGERLTTTERDLLASVASQAAVALRNVRLSLELQARLAQISSQADELEASRRRIIAAQDQERRRLERDIHDGAQQHLVGMSARLRTARQVIGSDPDRAARLLDQVTESMSETVVALRDLARGIFPQVLADKGLHAALKTQLTKNHRGARLKASASAVGARCDPRVEAAAYFCCLEALQNAAKHAAGARVTLTLDVSDDWVTFSVSDEGPGLPAQRSGDGSGIQNMTDRAAAVGGDVEVTSSSAGVTVTGCLPRYPDSVEGPVERGLADAP